MYFLTLKGQFENLTSGQVRSRLDHDPSRSMCTSSEAACDPSRLEPFARFYLHPVATNWRKTECDLIWSPLTSGDLPVTPDHQLRPGLHRWGDWPLFWRNWVVSISLCETGSIFTFHFKLIMGRPRNWPDLRSPGYKFHDIHFIGIDDLKQSCKFHTGPTWSVAMAWLRFF